MLPLRFFPALRFGVWRLMALLVLLFGGLGAVVAQQSDQEFLQPEEAFRLTVEADGADKVRVVWDVADGYYLYRNKFAFSTSSEGMQIGAFDLPAGQIKVDEFFGEVETLRGRVEVELPIQRSPGAGDLLVLQTRSQGCADAGLCYPPQRHSHEITLPPLVQAADTASALEPNALDPAATLDRFGRDSGIVQEDDGIIPVEQAYVLQARNEGAEQLVLEWQVAPGTYLYHDKLEVVLVSGEGVTLGQPQLPDPKIKHDTIRADGTIGDVAVYEHDFTVVVPLLHDSAKASQIQVKVSWQGCAEIGICYPPRNQTLTFDLPVPKTLASADSVAAASQATSVQKLPESSAAAVRSEQDQIADVLRGDSVWLILLSFFVFGLLLSLTPCIFPMIPILSGIIAGQKGITTRQSFTLSLVYVLAMAVTYAAAGILAAVFGQNLQAAFQDPWVLSVFIAIFVLLALSMFGFYDLQLPSGLQSRISALSNKQQGGSLIGVAIMGFLSALIIGPCVAPPLAGALIYVGQTGDWLLGGLALFVMALGMGVPLLLIGASAGKLLPRAGAWMEAVKGVFGVGLLAVALVLLERIVPPAVAMVCWGTLMIVSGIYMGALRVLPDGIAGWYRLWKGLGLVLVIYGGLMLVGAAAGGRDTVQPLRGIAPTGGGAEVGHMQFRRIKSLADLEREVQAAAGPVMLDFYADWCVSCKEMERYTFSDPTVIQALSGVTLLQADVTADDEIDRELQGHFGLPGPPAIIFYGADKTERSNYRVVGFMEAKAFAAHVTEAIR